MIIDAAHKSGVIKMQHLEYFKVPKVLFKDETLNLDEFKYLVKIFSKIEPSQVLTKQRWMLEKKEIDINRELINSLQKKNWLIKESNQLYLNIPESIVPKEKEQDIKQIRANAIKKFGKTYE